MLKHTDALKKDDDDKLPADVISGRQHQLDAEITFLVCHIL
jgi:hypothetical protein